MSRAAYLPKTDTAPIACVLLGVPLDLLISVADIRFKHRKGLDCESGLMQSVEPWVPGDLLC